MHVLNIIANCSSVPYFNQFAEEKQNYPDVKFSFVALYHEKPKMLADMAERNCDCYWLKFDWRNRKTSMLLVFFRLYKLLKKLKPDVVNTHLFDDSLPALFAAKLARVKIRVIHKQDTAFHLFYKPIWVWADRFNNFNATHIVAVSKESENFIIEKEKADINKVYLIHSGIDINAITSSNVTDRNLLENKFDLKDKLVIGTISRYIDWKGYKYIIEAASIVVKKYKNAKFLFIGTGDQQAELEELVAKYNLQENIVFTGWISNKLIPSLISLMNIYVHAAVMEPFGFAISEAMANGIPLVVTKTGGSGDVLTDKETCYFTEYRSPKSIADGIQWVFENPEKTLEMSGKLKKLAVENFTVERMLKNFVQLYQGEYTNR